MEGAKAGDHACPQCFKSFRGTQGPAHDQFMQPLLLRCGHTFCQGCISKQVKVLKTSITCPYCQVSTPMPHGEASAKLLPTNYYALGLATSSSKQVMDMLDQKIEGELSSKLNFQGVMLEGYRELCTNCLRIFATCQCQQCNDDFCEPCFLRTHRGSRTFMGHNSVPLGASRGRGGCKEHGDKEVEFFCQDEEVPICALCALVGSHKGHDIIQLSDKDQEALKELKPALDKAKDVLKRQYYAVQMTRDTKREIRKELTEAADVVKASFARILAVLQLRQHALLEQIVGAYAQQSKYFGAMLTNIEGNVCVLEAAMIDAMTSLEDKSTMPANVTKLVHTLRSAHNLPSHAVVPAASIQQQPLSHFTYSSDVVSSLMSFGAVNVNSERRCVVLKRTGEKLSRCSRQCTLAVLRREKSILARRSKQLLTSPFQNHTSRKELPLKTDSDLPPDWEPPDIKDDILNNSAINTYKKHREDRERVQSTKSKTQPRNAAVQPKRDDLSPCSDTSKGKESKLIRGHQFLRTINVFGRELVRVTHIRNPCCFYIQQESDQSRLSKMLVRINKECEKVPVPKRMPDDLSIGALCCCLYAADKTWYRARIKSVIYPDLDHATTPSTLTPPTSPNLLPEQPHGRGGASQDVPPQADKDHPDDGGVLPDHDITDTLLNIKSEIGSETSSDKDQLKADKDHPDDGGVLPDHDITDTLLNIKSEIGSETSSDKDQTKADKDHPDDGGVLPDHDITDTLLNIKSEIGSETSSEHNYDLSVDIKLTVKLEAAQDPDDGGVLPDHDITDTLLNIKSEIGSETSSELSHDLSVDIKPTVKLEADQDVRPKVKAQEPKVEVLYIDYGNSETVPLSRLCRLKRKHHSIPDMAVCCSLTDIVPNHKSGRWSLEAVHSFAQMVEEKTVSMSIRGHSGTTLYVDIHKPPLLELENDVPVSLRDALVFLEMACFVSPESVPKPTPTRGPPLKFIPPDLPYQGDEIVVTVSHYQDPNCFCVQEAGQECKYFLNMTKELQETYSKNLEDKWKILCPRKGDICVAFFSETKQWARAEIVDLPGKQKVDVLYVDFGNYERVHWSKLRKIAKKFLKLGVQALPCSLVDVCPKDSEKGWTTEEKEGFGVIAVGKILRASIKGLEKGRLSIILMKERQNREININALLVQKGFAQSSGPGSVSAAIIFDMPNMVTNEETPFSDSVASVSVRPSLPTTKETVLPFGSTCPQKSQLSPMFSAQYTVVHVSHMESPACIFIQLSTAGKDGLDSLLEAMTSTYKQLETFEDVVWQEGSICSALLVREGAWCRGRIKSLLPDDNAVILFTDYGNTEVVSLSHIRPLLEKFHKDPPFAIQCHLADVIPGGDKGTWTKTACEFLAAMLSDLECVIVKKGELEDGSLPIDLLYERSIEEKVEQQTLEGLASISKLLILKGLALPVKHGPSTCREKLSSDGLKSPGVSSASPNVGTPSLLHSTSTPPTNTSTFNHLSEAAVRQEEEVVAKQPTGDYPEYRLLPLPKSNRMDLVITFVNPNGIISGLEASQVEAFRDVIERLQAANAVRQTTPTAEQLQPGQALCAQFQEDNLWYRAKVIAVQADSVEVFYVDYGNSEVVPLSSIHLKPYMLDMPQQSRQCTLFGLRPKSPNKTWPAATIRFLMQRILEQSCTAVIKSRCKKGEPLKVDLLLPSGESINGLLLAQDLANAEEQDSNGNQPDPNSENQKEPRDAVALTPGVERAVTPDISVTMAGPGTEYQPMLLPAPGSRLVVWVTHITKPDMVYIQPCGDRLHTQDPMLLESSKQFERISMELNKMAPSLPHVTDPQPGLCCCAVYQVNQQWLRTIIEEVKPAEDLCEVTFVDYGTFVWVPTSSLRQIPEKFTLLPMQARHCRLVGLKPPPPSTASNDTELLNWPVASVDQLVKFVSNKWLIAAIQVSD